MDLTFFSADSGHARVLARHRCEMFREMGILPDGHYDELRGRSIAFFESAIPAGTYLAFLAAPTAEPDEVLGGAGVQIRHLMPRPAPDESGVIEGPQGLIVNMFVEPPYRRRGIARTLLEHVLRECRSRGIRSVLLHASAAGRPLYEQRGFRPTNEMGIYLGDEPSPKH